MKPLKFSTVFRRAAEYVAVDLLGYSCDAIHHAAEADIVGQEARASGALLFYRELFTPAVDSPELYWLRDTGMTKEERKEWRIMALLFASEIARAEGR